MTAPELKQCPFCGGKASLITGEECAYVQCLDVKMHRGPFIDGDNDAASEAAAAWNRRADLAAVPAQVKSGPQIAGYTCKGCANFHSEYWSEPSGDGETYDSGTSAKCMAADRNISTYYGSAPTTPDWCPAPAIDPAAIREAALREAVKSLRDWQTHLNRHSYKETAITIGMSADVVEALIGEKK